MKFVLVLHVVAAIFIIGPLTLATSASPRFIKQGDAGLEMARWMSRTTLIYGLASLLVAVLGLAMVHGDFSFNQFWIGASLTLYIVALVLLFAIVYRDQRTAIHRLEAGEVAPVQAGRILASSAVVAVIWLAIVFLMFYQPGGPSGG